MSIAGALRRSANILQTDATGHDNTETYGADKIRLERPSKPDRTAPDNTEQHWPDSGLPSSNPRVGGSSPSGRASLHTSTIMHATNQMALLNVSLRGYQAFGAQFALVQRKGNPRRRDESRQDD